MRMDELKGYRSDPMHAVVGREFDPHRMRTHNLRDAAMDRFSRFMEEHGFKTVGRGSYAGVYQKDGYPWLFKVFAHDPGYLWYVNWAAKHQDNPNVPRIKGLPMRIAPDTYVIRLEKLDKLVRRHGNLTHGYEQLAYLLNGIESMDDLSKEDLQWISKEYPGVYDILRVIQRAGNRFVVDIHGENIMMRGQTPVIADPLVG